MKRFFKPIEKEGSAKKPALAQEDSEGKIGENGDNNTTNKQPLKFITWNANSLLLRAKNDWPEFTKFVSTLDPDVIAIQEVRMPAAGSKGAPKNPGELKDDTSSSREEKQILMRALSSPPFGSYKIWWSLADSKYAGTALLVKKRFHNIKVSFSLDKSGGDSFREKKMDKRMLEFVVQLSDKPLIWCGDLNVSHEEIDVSHPEFFIAAKQNGYVPPNKEDCGQPGFTLNERKRFGSILREGKLIDAYRFLHKEKDMERGFSWSGNPIGKYRGKRMRIDYFIVSEKLKGRIISCEMHGQGIELQGFYGSDHCPVSLELVPTTCDSRES
ncbi:ap endonuclease, putative [Ricinus communis]|uniref:Ap endonuclease, putative n=1 Tax=Ricinus communis TaxID=3988 RepID=B9RAP1_RICCO|nr:ap endonuclease, putative [Ricinus communis]